MKGTKPKMILKRGSNTPVQLKHSHQSEASSDVVAAEDRGTNRKHKNPKGGKDDVVTDSHELGDQNPDSKKLQKGQKDQKKKKKKKLTPEEKQQLAIQRAELVKKNRATKLSKEIKSLSQALQDSVLGRITEIIEVFFQKT